LRGTPRSPCASCRSAANERRTVDCPVRPSPKWGLQITADETLFRLAEIQGPSVQWLTESELCPGRRAAVDRVEAGAIGYPLLSPGKRAWALERSTRFGRNDG